MNIKSYDIDEKFSLKRIERIHNMLLNALKFELDDVIYNMILEWNWIDVLCLELNANDLLKIMALAKKYKDFNYYTD